MCNEKDAERYLKLAKLQEEEKEFFKARKNYLEAAKELERCMEKALEFGWAMDAAPNAVHAAEFYFLANILTKAHDLYFKAEKYRKDMEKFSTDGEIIKRLDKLKKIFS